MSHAFINQTEPHRDSGTTQDRVAELYRHPRHKGTITAHEHAESAPSSATYPLDEVIYAEGANPLCGDTIRMNLVIDEASPRIRDAHWDGYACSLCSASAEALLESVIGISYQDCLSLNADSILAKLGNPKVSSARRACVELPLNVMKKALGEQ